MLTCFVFPQSSGVAVNSEALQAFQTLKLGKQAKYIIFSLNSTNTEIVTLTTGEKNASYDDFLKELPADQCRWAVFDYEYETDDGGKRNKLVFFSWCVPLFHCSLNCAHHRCRCRSPDDAKIKQKMVSASSRDVLRRALVGIGAEIQGTEYAEVAEEEGASYSWLSML